MAGLFLYPIIAAVMRCIGLYCVRGIGNITRFYYARCGAFGSPSSRPALLSFGCSLLTGARGAFNRVIFRVLAVLSRARNAIDSGRGTA
nr:MAG TPA: hypothetical protein [Caudoviricetes sp.]